MIIATEKLEGHTRAMAGHVSFEHGCCTEPEQCSFAWVFVNDFVDPYQIQRAHLTLHRHYRNQSIIAVEGLITIDPDK
jgi:hypothetical protein